MIEPRKRITLHLARAEDAAPQVPRLPFEDDAHYAKRCASIRALGPLWVRSPAYVFDPRHSVHLDVWLPAHRLWWKQVHEAALRDRERNPTWQRAREVLLAMGAK